MLDIGSGPAVGTALAGSFFLYATARAVAAFVSLRPYLRQEGLPPRAAARFLVEARGRESDWERGAREGWSALARFRTWSTWAAVSSLLVVFSLYFRL